MKKPIQLEKCNGRTTVLCRKDPVLQNITRHVVYQNKVLYTNQTNFDEVINKIQNMSLTKY